MSDHEPRYDAETVFIRDTIGNLVRLTLPHIRGWEVHLQPQLSEAVDRMMAVGHLPIETADAFYDIGHFLHRCAEDLMRERQRRGLPLPPGPDDEPEPQ